jgi:lactoylglutathione lyase
MIDLAKPALDVGLFTNDRDAMLAFWQQDAGVPFSELLPLGGGLQQHRHAIGQSVLKLNHARAPLPDAPPGGIRRLLIAREGIAESRPLQDPDGNALVLVPPGNDGIVQLRVELVVNDLAAHRAFYGEALGLPALDERTFCCGASQIRLIEGPATRDPVQQARGYRYMTIQVFDVKGVHAGILARGGREGRPPVRLGEVAHISFVRDPDGNWLEISQRKSLTGSLD